MNLPVSVDSQNGKDLLQAGLNTNYLDSDIPNKLPNIIFNQP